MISQREMRVARLRMVEHQLRARDIHDERVLTAMARVPRHLFVPAHQRTLAYRDCALPIACEQTISQPYMVAIMTQLLELQGAEHVLEVGTGSGYQTAILAELAKRVTTVERHRELSVAAEQRLQELGYGNIEFHVGDGSLAVESLSPEPFDRILVTAGATDFPQPLLDALVVGGILVIPVGSPECQSLFRVDMTAGGPKYRRSIPCRFVPLVSSEEP
ncbi:MAG: protein-L-isoaspartate(D-aspartate) O-methyltransferase [Planctomycetales bacterium]|nr:protein-L-isoaspartate(D-aspartate) O-methyltransferase [Planctomycetales bacterium]